MEIEELLEVIGLDFKIVDATNNMKIIKVNGKLHICCISQKGNQFTIDRDTFDYLDLNSIPYCFLLLDTIQNRCYYLPLNKENNWVKLCFLTCDKEKIHLGKQVLNSRIEIQELKDKLSRYR